MILEKWVHFGLVAGFLGSFQMSPSCSVQINELIQADFLNAKVLLTANRGAKIGGTAAGTSSLDLRMPWCLEKYIFPKWWCKMVVQNNDKKRKNNSQIC